ncbi:MAG TPA: Spy/CpxP family protein refolding chaperone [Bacteroidota bacterium]|nr:Spy/CpxP family protein refolding chaperone [Bacteroidota bacterium]
MRFTLFGVGAIILSLFLVCPDAPAQGPGRPRLSPEERAAELKKVLNLTDEQTSKVKVIYEQQEKEMRELFASTDGDRAAMREAMQQKVKEMDEKILAVLNTDQQKKYKQWVEERRSRFEQRLRKEN